MTRKNFSENWIFFKADDPSNRSFVDLPHDAMIYENRSEDSCSHESGSYFEGKDYVYQKTFFAEDDLIKSKVVLEFEGVYRNAEVFINGTRAGFRPYGYTNFYVDATKYLNIPGENTIEVTAENSKQPNCRWYSGAGIYRPVHMLLFPEKHIELNSLKIKTLSISPAMVEVFVRTNGNGECNIEILDDERVIAVKAVPCNEETSAHIPLPFAKLWDCDHPNLYTCRVTYYDDVVEQTFGVCITEVSASQGLLVNGKKTILKGACLHHDNGLLGAVTHPFAEERKVRLMKECGFNAIRCAHNPCSKAFLAACDHLGMYVVDEYVDMWMMHKSKYDYADYIMDWWQKDLSDMSEKDFNHPSVIMYSVGNEVCESAKDSGIEFCANMVQYLKSIDYRPVTCGINIFFNYLSSLGLGVYSDKKAEKSAKVKKRKAVGSEFFNQLAGIFGDEFMKFGATLRGSDRKTKGVFATLDVSGYNYGIKRYKKDVKKYPSRVILGTETFCSDAYAFTQLAKEHSAIIGDFIWAGMDYIGEVGIGAWEYADNAPIAHHGVGWITAGSGRYDITGEPGAEAAYIRVVYDKSPLEMAVVSPAHYRKKHSPSAWKMSNALLSWNYKGFEGKSTKLEVYTKAHHVEVFVNDKLKGRKKRNLKDCRINFKLKYNSGQLKVKAFDEDNQLIAQKMYKTDISEPILQLQPENGRIGIHDLAYVRIKIGNGKGEVAPLEKSEVSVRVDGGELIGLGNGCSYSKWGYKTNRTITYFGEALAIIKPTQSGSLVVCAKSNYGNAETEIAVD